MLQRIIALTVCSFILMGLAPVKADTAGNGAVGEVTAARVNVRTGPDTLFPVINHLNRNDKVRVLGSINGWLMVLLPDDSIGMVSGKYVQVTEPDSTVIYEGSDLEENPAAPTPAAQGLTDAERLFQMVNGYRASLNLPPYENDEKLNEAAILKADDMVINNYFNHNSPVYGTPFNMLKNMGAFYKTASENLACTADVEEAFTKMTENLAHRTNLVSQRYNNMGIGVADDVNEPGKKIIVLLFTEE